MSESLGRELVIRRGEWGEIVWVEGKAVIYAKTPPEELLNEGLVVRMADFHQAAEAIGASKAAGTLGFKKAIHRLAEGCEPFSFVRQYTLPSNESGHGLCTTWGYTGVRLSRFYIRTQELHDCLIGMSERQAIEAFGKKGSEVVAATLFDSGGDIFVMKNL